eukprot:COSAG02_NODE_884_length_16193_cov_20.464086_10_plen_51_part_00
MVLVVVVVVVVVVLLLMLVLLLTLRTLGSSRPVQVLQDAGRSWDRVGDGF